MKNVLTLIQILYSILYIIHTNYVKGDLPIHVEIHNLIGKWEILPTETSTVISNCGSSYPNNNIDNLKVSDYKKFLIENKFTFDKPFSVILSDEYVKYGELYDTKGNEHRKNWKILAVYNEDGNVIGSWTTIYDEGFEIRIGNSTFTAIMHYEPNGKCKKISNEDSLDSNGETECYTTSYNKIRFGWFDKFSISRAEDIVYGCFYAEKVENSNSTSELPSFSRNYKKSIQKSNNKTKESNLRIDQTSSAFQMIEDILEQGEETDTLNDRKSSKHYSQKSSSTNHYPENSELSWHKEKYHGKKKKLSDEILTTNSKQKYACPCNPNEDVENSVHKEKSLNIVSNSMVELEHSVSSSYFIEQGSDSVTHSSDLNNSNKLDLETYETTAKEKHRELDIVDLPKQFTWGDPFNNNAREYDVLNQLKCGSCYIASLLYTFKRRIEIGLTKKLGKEFLQNFDDNLSIQSILSCSFYDQGCHGGYPFLVAKQGHLQGIPLDSCMPYTAVEKKCVFPIRHSFFEMNTSENVLKNVREIRRDSTEDSSKRYKEDSTSLFSFIDKHNSCAISNRWFVKNYGYIGGCYGCNQCNGEQIMMNEIIQNGPIVASFEASPGIYNYTDGVYYEENYPHAKRCSIKKNKFMDFNITGWEKVNHAIVLVGWGEEEINGKLTKYWIARNSWGVNWGKQGYFKIIRGINFNAIESQTIFVDADFTRGAGKKIMDILSSEK